MATITSRCAAYSRSQATRWSSPYRASTCRVSLADTPCLAHQSLLRRCAETPCAMDSFKVISSCVICNTVGRLSSGRRNVCAGPHSQPQPVASCGFAPLSPMGPGCGAFATATAACGVWAHPPRRRCSGVGWTYRARCLYYDEETDDRPATSRCCRAGLFACVAPQPYCSTDPRRLTIFCADPDSTC